MVRKPASRVQRLPRSVQEMIRTAPSPGLAENNLQRLLDATRQNLTKFPDQELSALVQLVGSSSFLADILWREGVDWPDLFFRQVSVAQKTRAEHARELDALVAHFDSFD